jgi:hypothetical protein
VALQADGAMKCVQHAWRRSARPVVVVVNDPLAREKGGETYNAECRRCGARAWLHWPEPVYRR